MTPPKVLRSIQAVKSLGVKRAAVTLGVFDGVHLGHRRTIEELIQARKREAIDSCFVITFDPHPLVVTHSKITPPMLTTIEERIFLLSKFDIDGIVVLKFDNALADVDYRTFLEKYLINPFDMKLLVLGYDCHFGKNREGSPERVKQDSTRLGFETRIVPALKLGEEVVSSTKIRNAIMEGTIDEANRLLGHPYIVSGRVVAGHGKGQGLGFPTANVSVADPYKLWPQMGVYAVKAECDGKTFRGMMNIGRAPTMKELAENEREIEVHLFDYEGDLYGKELLVQCCQYLRSEMKFPSPEALIQQLQADREAAVRCLAGEA